MNKITLDNRIMGGMPKSPGANYESTNGCNHNGVADTIDSKIDSKSITLNSGDLNPNRAKPNSMNPSKDMGFLNKGDPSMDTTNHGKLTRSCQD